ncbi:hypothetical protein GKF31_25805 [Escherichia coli]|nr:hypothetical protein [Escherichia coli]
MGLAFDKRVSTQYLANEDCRAANNRMQFDGESGRRKAKTRLLGGFFK